MCFGSLKHIVYDMQIEADTGTLWILTGAALLLSFGPAHE
jgi:hypothetical protein